MTFILSKLLWILVSPVNLFAILLFISLFLAVWGQDRVARFARRFALFLSGVFLLLMILPIGTWLLLPLEKAVPENIPNKVDGIILLGGDESAFLSRQWGHPSLGGSASRHIHFARLAKRFPEAKLVFTGGVVWFYKESLDKNTPIIKESMQDIGVPLSRLLIEDASRNTYENAVFSKKLVSPKKGEHWLLVTSAYHMPRSIGIFRKVGWDVYPAPTGYMTSGLVPRSSRGDLFGQLSHLNTAVHEYIGLVAYYLMGRTASLWP